MTIFAFNTCLFFKQTKKKTKGEPAPATKTEVENQVTSLAHFHYGKNSEPATEPVDPASVQNHMGPPGQPLTSLDSSWECWDSNRDTTRVDSSRRVAPDEVRHLGAGHGPAGGPGVARKHPTESNGTPAMDLRFDIHTKEE